MNSGRAPETKALGLDKLGVQLDKETGKIVVGADESTSVPNIYAFGDIGEVGIMITTMTAESALITSMVKYGKLLQKSWLNKCY